MEGLVRKLQRELEYFHQKYQSTAPVQHPPSTQLSFTEPAVGQFIFQIENPESQAGKFKASTEPAIISEFLQRVPVDEDGWSKRRDYVQLCKPEELLHTFRLLTRLSRKSCSFDIGHKLDDKESILDVLRDYGRFANALGAHKVYATQISNYGTLLFICLSIVARKTGAKPEVVDEHIKKFLMRQQEKCDAGSEYLTRLRTAALWPVKQMNELYRKGLKHRAWEMFVLCGPSIHFYKKLALVDTEEVTSRVVICEPPEGEVQADVPFDITFLTKIILGERCSLDQINKALGTDLREETFNTWFEALSRRTESISKSLPCKRRKLLQEDGNSSTEASSDQDVCLTPRTTATDSTQYGEILGEMGTAIIGKFPHWTGLPPDERNNERGVLVYGSSGQHGGSEATGYRVEDSEADFMDKNTLPSTYVNTILHMDIDMSTNIRAMGLDMFDSE